MPTWLVDGETVVPAEQQEDGTFVVLVPQVGGGYAEGAATVPNTPGSDITSLASEHSTGVADVEAAALSEAEAAYNSALVKDEYEEVPAGVEWSVGGELAPLMLPLGVTQIEPLLASVTWDTDPDTEAGTVYYRVQGETEWTTQVEDIEAPAESHIIEFAVLPDTTYEVYVESPGDDDTGRSIIHELTTDPLEVPEITNVAADTATFEITWDTDLDSDSTVFYRETGTDTWSEANEPALTMAGHSVTLAGLAAATEHDFYVRSVTPYGGSADSEPDTFTTDA